MLEVKKVFAVNKPVAEVQSYLKDFANAEEWDAGTKSCTRVSAGPITVGTSWKNVSEFKGKETELSYRLTKLEPSHLQFVGQNKTVTSTDDLTFAAVSGGTSITYSAKFDFHGIAKLASPFLRGALNKLGDQTAAQMKTVINAK